jgi:hypothetical protein
MLDEFENDSEFESLLRFVFSDGTTFDLLLGFLWTSRALLDVAM